MPGITTLLNWTHIDKRSGETITGIVLQWNLGSALQANVLRDQMNATGGSRGGAGVSNARPATGRKPTTPSRTRPEPGKPFVKPGLKSDDDDF